MTPKEFYDKVVEMRKAQKEYFRFRAPSALSKSKQLEAEIDAEIKRVEQLKKPGKLRFSGLLTKIY